MIRNFYVMPVQQRIDLYLHMRFLLTCIIIFIVVESSAQFNDSVHHYARFSSTGIINKTNNSSSYVLSNGLNFNTLAKRVALNTSAGWVYGANQNSQTNNDLALHADMNFFKEKQKLYYWALANFDKSYSLKINYRWQAGAGISYNFIDSPALRINVSDGILFENGDITDGAILHKKYSTPRNSFRLLVRWSYADRFSITSINFYQPSLQDINDYVIQSTSNVSVKLYKWLSFTGSLLYNKITSTNRKTTLITYGLTMEKYF